VVLRPHQHPVEQCRLTSQETEHCREPLRSSVDLEQALALRSLDLHRRCDEVGEELGVGRQPEVERIALTDALQLGGISAEGRRHRGSETVGVAGRRRKILEVVHRRSQVRSFEGEGIDVEPRRSDDGDVVPAVMELLDVIDLRKSADVVGSGGHSDLETLPDRHDPEGR
jgi:hypothetical protein